MAILNFLPEFKVVEPNRLTGLVAGHVLAQFPLDTDFAGITAEGGVDYLSNGFILGLGANGELAAFDTADHAQPLLVYTEELVTFLAGNKWFANEADGENGTIYPRAIGLFVGDSFTTNNYVATSPVTLANVVGAKVVGGVLTLQSTVDANTIFKATRATLATGVDAVQLTYIGKPLVVAAAE
jgi:hypothetical protein